MANINFLNEQNETVYNKFISFEHEHLHKLDNMYSDTVNSVLSNPEYTDQLDAYLSQKLISCEFELPEQQEGEEEKSQKELIEENYSHEDFVLLFIRTAYRAVNRDSKIYDSMLDDDLHEFEED